MKSSAVFVYYFRFYQRKSHYKTKENLLKQIFTNYDQLPVMLSPDQVASALGISRANAYTLFHADDFPSMRVGKRMMISKVHFLKWIERQSGGAA